MDAHPPDSLRLLEMYRHLISLDFELLVSGFHCLHPLEIKAKDLTLKHHRFWLISLVTLFGTPCETCVSTCLSTD